VDRDGRQFVGEGGGVGRLTVGEYGEPNTVCAVQGVKRLLRQDIDLGEGLRC